jgi:hypothetical protein
MATPMFSWLFGKKDQATRGEDSVWLSDAARLRGILREVERLVKQGCSVVVVAWTLPTFDHLARAFDQYKPLLCRDLFGFDVLRGQLARAGSVAVALANTLSSDVKTLTDLAVVVIVYGRNDMRATDDTIVRFADLVGPNTRVAFHLSLDDALLKDYIGALKSLLIRLDVPPDEAISHPMVTRAIAGAQAKKRS